MNETSKCFDLRVKNFDFDNYLKGFGIDIGCGSDPLRLPDGGAVDRWDLEQGDAQEMLGVSDAKYDFVYSSHCLEHMRNVPAALKNWIRILKPGGFLYVVVPDYCYYEKYTWPSRFNGDHKHSFSLDLNEDLVNRANHWKPWDLIASFGLDFGFARLEIQGFDFNRGVEDQTRGVALSQICFGGHKRIL